MKVGFKTLGCRLNQYDTEWLREEFELAGFQTVDVGATRWVAPAPDIWVVNTCAVTSKALREARNIIRSLGKNAFVIVTGCGVASDYEELSHLNGVQVLEPDPRKIATRFLKTPLLSGITSFKGYNKAFIKIQEGCDQFCAYCIVPYIRGTPRQRAKQEILDEVKNLINNGYKEFILTGTNISKYGTSRYGGDNDLLDLIKSIVEMDGVLRLGISSIEPYGISDVMLNLFQHLPQFARYFHIPLQSGDPKVLKLMNRWYTPEEYSELIYRIKDKLPDSAIGTDIIVGFPGEGEQEFMNTYNLILKLPISRLHTFRYSKRPWIKAIELQDEPTEKAKKQRSELIRKLGEKKWEDFRKQFIGKVMPVHIESPPKADPDYCRGKSKNGWQVGVTSNYIKVLFKLSTSCPAEGGINSQLSTSEFINLRIKEVIGPKTYGEVVSY